MKREGPKQKGGNAILQSLFDQQDPPAKGTQGVPVEMASSEA